jgi:hypothetical protein
MKADARNLLFTIDDRIISKWFDKNIITWAPQATSIAHQALVPQDLAQDPPLFRNDDVSWDTSLEEFRSFCAVFHKHKQFQVHGVTLRGCTNTAHIRDGVGVEYQGFDTIAKLDNATIRQLSEGRAIEDRTDLVDYLNASPDEVALHGLYHTDYSTMSAEEQDRDITEGLALMRRLFPGKRIRFFIAPFNRTNTETYAVAARHGLTVQAEEGVALEAELHRLRLQPGQWYRYHHHRFYPQSLFAYYPLSIERLDKSLERNLSSEIRLSDRGDLLIRRWLRTAGISSILSSWLRQIRIGRQRLRAFGFSRQALRNR